MAKGDDTDSFSKAIVGIINQFLSEHKTNFVCIIAGYEKEIREDFFGCNPGLERRFAWKYTFEPYKPKHLRDMFLLKISNIEWIIGDDVKLDVFTVHHKLFTHQGGDVENFLEIVKRCHTRRIFGLSKNKARIITQADINKATDIFVKSKGSKEDTDMSKLTYFC